jgi:serine/threonine protein kinase
MNRSICGNSSRWRTPIANMNYQAFRKRYQYHPSQRIGKGGFGSVYKAFDTETGRNVAIKISPLEDDREKFTLQREFELVKNLKHPNIVQYEYCACFETDMGWMEHAVLTYYPKGDLEDFLTNHVLTLAQTRQLVRGILTGLQYLHHNQIIHRDFKARNILIAEEYGAIVPKITDFGLGRSTDGKADMTNTAIGLTRVYAAPEQLDGLPIRSNVDLWALGVVLYRIVAGELPFGNLTTTMTSREQERVNHKIRNVELPEKLNTVPQPYQYIIRRCLVSDISKRVQVADELLYLLDNHDMRREEVPPIPVNNGSKTSDFDTPTEIPVNKSSKTSDFDTPTEVPFNTGSKTSDFDTPTEIPVNSGSKPFDSEPRTEILVKPGSKPSDFEPPTEPSPQPVGLDVEPDFVKPVPKKPSSDAETEIYTKMEPEPAKRRIGLWIGGVLMAAVASIYIGVKIGQPNPDPSNPSIVAPSLPPKPEDSTASKPATRDTPAAVVRSPTKESITPSQVVTSPPKGSITSKPNNNTPPLSGNAAPTASSSGNTASTGGNAASTASSSGNTASSSSGNTASTASSSGNMASTASSSGNPAKNSPIQTLDLFQVEQKPIFNNDKDPENKNSVLLKYIHDEVRKKCNAAVDGTLTISFVVDENGDVVKKSVKITRRLGRIGSSCDQEVMNAVEALPRWKPGSDNGSPVKVRVSLPVFFKLSN